MTINRPTLKDSFGGAPERGSGLAGLLSTPKPTAAEQEPQKPEQAPPEATTPKPAQAPAPKTQPAAQADAKSPDDAIVPVGVYLEPEVLAVVKAERRRGRGAGEPDRKYHELLVEALGKVTLNDLTAAFSAPAQPVNSLLQPRPRRQRGVAGIQIQPQLSRQQTATLDQLVEQVGAPSRSALIAAAFRLAYMPT